jgi:hypothetical protein
MKSEHSIRDGKSSHWRNVTNSRQFDVLEKKKKKENDMKYLGNSVWTVWASPYLGPVKED